MGKKGDKLTNDATLLADILLERLQVISGITAKKMFGGYGVFHDNKMFGMVTAKGQAYLKANEDTKAAFIDKGGEKHSRMPYYSIPEDVMDNTDLMESWARKSIDISK